MANSVTNDKFIQHFDPSTSALTSRSLRPDVSHMYNFTFSSIHILKQSKKKKKETSKTAFKTYILFNLI